ncbi:hypothetical protein CWD94_25260 [Lysinibacillus xylanilyticus]|uniref:Uncharacterized protein n=1 Tax=Lysinibacillus xylanilyticus TaxID=582475 RepID=A0A2M9PZ31_9BACI|nr:hypothetical protein CWD94_25260 [Lysinibacillus xylanilyticus]
MEFDITDDIYKKEKSLVKTRLLHLNTSIKVLINSFREPYATSRSVQCELEIKVFQNQLLSIIEQKLIKVQENPLLFNTASIEVCNIGEE